MIRLGKLTDYAIVLLTQLSQGGECACAQELADATGVPYPTVAKVLKILTREKLAVSERGASGGYKLSRPASDISIGAIIEAMEGPIAITACVDGAEESCGSEKRCPVRGKWTPVNNAIRSALYDVKLSDMIQPAATTRRLYQITGGQHVNLD